MQHDLITSQDTLPLPSSLAWMWKITHIWRDSFSAEPTNILFGGRVCKRYAPTQGALFQFLAQPALVIKLPTRTVERTANIYQQIRRTSPMLPINQGLRMMFQQFSVCLSLSLSISQHPTFSSPPNSSSPTKSSPQKKKYLLKFGCLGWLEDLFHFFIQLRNSRMKTSTPSSVRRSAGGTACKGGT